MVNAVDYLNKIDLMDRMIKNKLTELYQYRALISGISAASADGDRVQTSQKTDKIGDAVVKIIEKENEISKSIEKYIKVKSDIISEIEGIENTMYYQILFSRYVEMKSFGDIANDIGYSSRQTLRIHEKAIDNFTEKYLTSKSCH